MTIYLVNSNNGPMAAYSNHEDAIKEVSGLIMEDSYEAYTELDLPKIEKDLR